MSAGGEAPASKKPGTLIHRKVGAILSVCLLAWPGPAVAPAFSSGAAPQETTRARWLAVDPSQSHHVASSVRAAGAMSLPAGLAEATRTSTHPCPTTRGKRLTRTGWFHIIWNGEPRFILVDDKGQWTRLLLDEAMTRPFGGPLVFNRKRVKVVGVGALGAEALCVLSIEFERDTGSK
jgi:hypothetical protein